MTETPFFQSAATWDARYSEPGYAFGTAPNAFLAEQASRMQAGKSALAVADGEGRNSVWLARQGLNVDAFDISPVGVDKARSLAGQAGVDVRYHVASCDSWRWQAEAYDYVVAIFVQFADPAMRARLFANMAAALRPGGLLILQGYTPRQLEYRTGGPGVLEHLYTEDLLKTAFAGLRMLDLRSYDAELNEGSRHSGKSALIGMVARK